jgi:hypothetical protein
MSPTLTRASTPEFRMAEACSRDSQMQQAHMFHKRAVMASMCEGTDNGWQPSSMTKTKFCGLFDPGNNGMLLSKVCW